MKRKQLFAGVVWEQNKKKWLAQIIVHKIRHFQYFVNKRDALIWYEEKARELGVYDAKFIDLPDGLEEEFK